VGTTPDESARWYAVHVRSNQERTTAAFVEGRGVEHFLPTYRTRSRRKDRRVMLERPLFKGYLFANIDIRGSTACGSWWARARTRCGPTRWFRWGSA
jgi:transcription antitermination factor NusG